jgi:glycosyltransferase involved in cell wall biosynthesis
MAQRNGGTVVPFLLNYYLNPVHPFQQYEAIFRYQNTTGGVPDKECFLRTVRVIDGLVDLWHVHNEGDWIAPWVRGGSRKPIIWDVHDLASHQRQREEFRKDEDASAAAADFIFCPSKTYEDILSARYGKERVLWYASAVPRSMFPILQPRASREGLVYEGGFSTDKWSHREWGPFLEKAGVPTVIFPAQVRKYNPPPFLQFVPTIAPDLLLRTLRFFEAGICGSPGFGPHPQVDGAMPNKIFEYVAAGLPILAVHPSSDMKEFIAAHEIGLDIDRPELLQAALDLIRAEPKYRKNAAALREEWSMDKEWQKIIQPIYQELVGKK